MAELRSLAKNIAVTATTKEVAVQIKIIHYFLFGICCSFPTLMPSAEQTHFPDSIQENQYLTLLLTISIS